MKQLGLGVNSSCLSRKFTEKSFQAASPPQNSVPALRCVIYGPTTLRGIVFTTATHSLRLGVPSVELSVAMTFFFFFLVKVLLQH